MEYRLSIRQADRDRNLIARHFRTMLIVLSFAFVLVVSAQAHGTTVRSTEHEGFARIVFEWGEPTRFEAAIEGRTLSIQFDRPIEADLDALVARLGGRYLLAGIVEPDSRTVTFELTRPFLLRSFPQALMVVIDLIEPESGPDLAPDTGQGAAGPEPAAAEPAYRPESPVPETITETSPALPVRVGEHDGFDRIVFDWIDPVDYAVEESGRTVTVLFARPATIDLATLRGTLPSSLVGVAATAGESELVVTFERATPGSIHHFLSGTFVALDFRTPSDAAAAEPTVPVTLPAAVAETDSSGPPASARQPNAGRAPVGDIGGSTAALAALEPSAAPTQTWGMAPSGRAAATPPIPLLPGASEPAYVAAASVTAEAPVVYDTAGDNWHVPVRLSHNGAGLRFRFAWTESTGAAVYTRNGSLWIVFDGKRHIALPNMGSPLVRNAGIRGGEELDVAEATVLRLDIEPDVYADVQREGTNWLVDIMRTPSDPLRMLAMRIEPDVTGHSRVVFPDSSVGPVLQFTDPVVGDQIAIVPLYGSGHGIAPGRNYAQFAVLPSVQGVVVHPYSEDVLVRGLRTGIEVSSAHGLRVSPLTASAAPLAGGGDAFSRILRFDDRRVVDAVDFTDSRNRFLRGVAMADDATRPEARLNLARFYVANDLYVDALGVLALIEEETPDLAQSSDFVVVRGAARYLAGRMDAAAHDLERPELDVVFEITVWRAAIATRRGDWEFGAELFKVADMELLRLPAAWQADFGLLAARAAVETGDIVRAHFRLDQIEKTGPTPLAQSEIDFLRGRAYALAANFDTAIDLWDQDAVGPDRLLRAKAALARVRLLRELDWITVPEAIETYESLRFAWRGDTFEQEVLSDLGALYMGQEMYLQGLSAWRQAVVNFEDSPITRRVAESMNDLFTELYVEGEAARLSPLDVVSVYFESRNLTPDGPVGDQIIGGLADRLVGVDLLDRAAALLEHQVDHRLTGAEKAQVGAKLAAIQLLDRNPDGALTGLELSRVDSIRLPVDLLLERRYLEARALLELDRPGEARQLLAGDSSQAAEMLRADIGWRDQNWSETATATERLLRVAAPERQDLSETERYYVMMRAVALTPLDDNQALAELQRRFGPAMADGAHAEAFRLIVSVLDPGRIPFREFAKAVADVSAIEAFLDGYREGGA